MVSFTINRPGVARDSVAAAQQSGSKPARSPRRRVLIRGVFQSLTSTNQVSIRNLSCTGASVVSDSPLKVGAQGVLQSTCLDCLCRIVWTRGNVYGIRFDQPLPNALVLELHRITAADVQRAQTAATKEWFDNQAR
jgi:hypothetical protein